MNVCFWSNSLDLYKYDLLTYLAKEDSCSILYVPMLTEPRQTEDIDPKYLTYEIGRKNESLFQFLLEQRTVEDKNIECISTYFHQAQVDFNFFRSNNSLQYFSDEHRDEYFGQSLTWFKTFNSRALLFFDPDVGSSVGIVRRFRSKREMYIKGQDLLRHKEMTKAQDYIGYFQHLGNTNYSVSNRVKDLKEFFGPWVIMAGYSRIQASMIFCFNDEVSFEDKREKIKQYFKQYEHLEHRDKFILE